MKSSQIHEQKLQNAIHFMLSDPSAIRSTKSGKRLQILSPGRLNVHEGPDFLEIAILLDGMVIVGDAEFHRRTSDWNLHAHDSDERYNSVILHIAFMDDDKTQSRNFEVLCLEESQVLNVIKTIDEEKVEADIFSIEELQHYALLRLLRKTSEAQVILRTQSLEKTLRQMVSDYITKYNSRRKRPVYTHDKLFSLIQNINESQFQYFLNDLTTGKELQIPDIIQTLIKNKISGEGAHLRREIVLNCILPIALCLANEQARISLFLWFWSTPALNTYGLLNRQFRDLPQNFLWQQQGMLEYIKEHGRKANVVSDVVKSYGFAEMLSFYRLGRSPLIDREA